MNGLVAQKTTADACSATSNSVDSTRPTMALLAPTKRKYGNRRSEVEAIPKRHRVMGRPRNDWTPSRLRKLVRLYLMTDLGVVEISKVLRSEGFTPCKRDVQQQLNNVLQTRPDKVRARGPLTKMRHRFFRECRGLRKERQSPMQHEGMIEDTVQQMTIKHATCKYGSTPIPQSSKVDLLGCEVGLSDNTPKNPQRKHISYQEPRTAMVDFDPLLPTKLSENSDTGVGFDHSYYPLPKLDNWSENINTCTYPPSINDLPLLRIDSSFKETNICPSRSDTTSESLIPCGSGPKSATAEVRITHSQDECDILQDLIDDPSGSTWETKFGFDLDLDSKDPAEQYAASVSDLGEKSSKASILSVSSLRKRLSLKYSESYLGDILSLMQNLTIAGSSVISTRRTARKFRKALSTTVASQIDAVPQLPSMDVIRSIDQTGKIIPQPQENLHLVVLPGAFPTYCWVHINNNELRPCRHGKERSPRGSNCPPTNPEAYWSIRPDVFHKILTDDLSSSVIDEVDIFGNSGVHVAAACKPLETLALYALWSNGKDTSWMHKLNNAGETFLHLVKTPSATNHADISYLLQDLQNGKFDFNQRDHHGQTALHLLTRPWVPREPLHLILNALLAANISIPKSRDNLGYTIKEQLQQADCAPGIIQRLFAEENKFKDAESYCLPNYGKNTAIETMEDLTMYAQHAELLRDIRDSLSNPLHEDTNGRNGLHCLAEVSLNLPLVEYPASPDKPSTTDTQREQYLQGLLKSGVDPNNHDKQGYTPLMAFIIHTRASEDDGETTRLLQHLIDAGAGINTRDRQGETPLHLAVKLGRRAATKFLLCRGANVHARDGDGLGMIALGEAASKKAKHDEILYAQIILCISLVVNAGAVSNPTILQEWGTPRYFD